MRKQLLLLMVGGLVSNLKVANTEEVILTDEHFLAVGNDDDGNGMLVITSKLASSFTVFTMTGHSVSSACGSHPSRCRELMVESTTISNFTSRHIVLVPLENGLQLLELYHNGTSSLEMKLTSHHTLMFSGIDGNGNCSSLGAHRIGASYYLPCVTTESLYICVLNLNTTAITQSTLQRCQQMLNIGTVELMSLSNMIPSNDAYVPSRHLLVLLQNVLYRLYPVTSVSSFAHALPSQCTSANQLLVSPKYDDELLVYCRDRTSIVYNTNFDQVVNSGELENVQYPCSPSTEFIIHLSQNLMDFSYKQSSSGTDTVKIFISPTTSDDFHSGVCFDYGNRNYLFAYNDQRMGVIVFNATSENFTLLPNTQSCGDGGCELLLVYNNQYLVVRNRGEKKVMVFDIPQGKMIIVLQNTTFQLVTLIHNIHVMHAPTEPTTTSITTLSHSESIPTNGMNNGQSLSSGIIAVVVVISIIIVLLTIAIIVVVICLVRVRDRRKSREFSPTKSEGLSNVDSGNQPQEEKELSVIEKATVNLEGQQGFMNPMYSLKPEGVSPTSVNKSTSQEGKDNNSRVEQESIRESEIASNYIHPVDNHESRETTTGSGNQNLSFSASADKLTMDHTERNLNEASGLDSQCQRQSDGDQTMQHHNDSIKSHLSSYQSPVNSKPKLEKTDSLYPLRTQFMNMHEKETKASANAQNS